MGLIADRTRRRFLYGDDGVGFDLDQHVAAAANCRNWRRVII